MTAPISMFSEMFVRCPRNLSHGPAMEMWSVVHLPSALIRTGHPEVVLAVPLLERLEELQALALRVDDDLNRRRRPSAFGAWKMESSMSHPLGGIAGAPGGDVKLERLAVRRLQRVRVRVEVEPPGEREHRRELRGGDERVRVRVAVVALREVAVVRS